MCETHGRWCGVVRFAPLKIKRKCDQLGKRRSRKNLLLLFTGRGSRVEANAEAICCVCNEGPSSPFPSYSCQVSHSRPNRLGLRMPSHVLKVSHFAFLHQQSDLRTQLPTHRPCAPVLARDAAAYARRHEHGVVPRRVDACQVQLEVLFVVVGDGGFVAGGAGAVLGRGARRDAGCAWYALVGGRAGRAGWAI